MSPKTFASRVRARFQGRSRFERRRPRVACPASGLERLEGRQLLSTAASKVGVHPTADVSPVEVHAELVNKVPPDPRQVQRGKLTELATATPSVAYYTAPATSPAVAAWQGIRAASRKGTYLMVGTTGATPSEFQGLLYVGTIDGKHGQSYRVDYPGSATTSIYGPDNLGGGYIRIVGSFRPASDTSVLEGFVYQGKISKAAFANPSNYHAFETGGATLTYMHSTDGALAVGNTGSQPDEAGGTFASNLYSVATGQIITPISYPGAFSTTTYGIVHNGGSSYTITGGFFTAANATQGSLGEGFVADYNASTGKFSNWTPIVAPAPAGSGLNNTHIEGVSLVKKGVYTLSADLSAPGGSTGGSSGEFVTLTRNRNGTFATPSFVPLNFTGTDDLTSANSVAGNQVVGLVFTTGSFPYQATVKA